MKRYLNLNGDINVNEHSATDKYCCDEMQCSIKSGNFSMGYRRQFAETYLVSREGVNNYWMFDFCPFCGKNIASKAEVFSKCVEDEFGINTESKSFDYEKLDEYLPKEFESDEWWKKRGL
jgi:DNA-directed RNA polymerase subunit N (RpoN/RPB10)